MFEPSTLREGSLVPADPSPFQEEAGWPNPIRHGDDTCRRNLTGATVRS